MEVNRSAILEHLEFRQCQKREIKNNNNYTRNARQMQSHVLQPMRLQKTQLSCKTGVSRAVAARAVYTCNLHVLLGIILLK